MCLANSFGHKVDKRKTTIRRPVACGPTAMLLVDNLIKKYLLGTVMLLKTSILTLVPGDHPGRRTERNPRPYVTLFPVSLRQFAGSQSLS